MGVGIFSPLILQIRRKKHSAPHERNGKQQLNWFPVGFT